MTLVNVNGLTNSCEQPGYGLALLVDNNLVLTEDTATDTLYNADLGGLLVLKLSQTEGEGSELLDNLGQKSS